MVTDFQERARRLRNAVEPVAAGVYFAPRRVRRARVRGQPHLAGRRGPSRPEGPLHQSRRVHGPGAGGGSRCRFRVFQPEGRRARLWSREILSRTFEHLVQQSGVRRIRFHDLRRTCASLLLAQGVSPRVVMDVLGHSQLSITVDLYSHVMPSALRHAADAMDRALNADSCAGYYPWFGLGQSYSRCRVRPPECRASLAQVSRVGRRERRAGPRPARAGQQAVPPPSWPPRH